MAGTAKKNFPSIPVSHWLSLRTQFKKSIPGTMSSNYLASVLSMTELSAKNNIIPSLKQIGLIDIEGKTNQDLAKKFRDDETYPNLCRTIIQSVYPQDVQDAFPDNDANKDRVKSWFMNHSGQGESGGGKMASFYLALLSADPSVTNGSTSKSSGSKRDAKPKSVTPKKPSIATPTSYNNKHTDPEATQRSNGPELNINIQIHISSDASPDQIKSIFENMAKYVYKS